MCLMITMHVTAAKNLSFFVGVLMVFNGLIIGF